MDYFAVGFSAGLKGDIKDSKLKGLFSFSKSLSLSCPGALSYSIWRLDLHFLLGGHLETGTAPLAQQRGTSHMLNKNGGRLLENDSKKCISINNLVHFRLQMVTLLQAVCFPAVSLVLQSGQEVKVLCPAQINSCTNEFTGRPNRLTDRCSRSISVYSLV